MEIVVLNEQLREQFAPVLSALRPSAAASASSSASSSRRHGASEGSSAGVEPSASGRIDHFRMRCLAIVRCLNTYKFGTRDAFKREIETLKGFTGGNSTAAAALEVRVPSGSTYQFQSSLGLSLALSL